MADWTPSYTPPLPRRLARSARGLLPLTVWLACATLVVWLGLFEDRRPAIVGIVSSQHASIITPCSGRVTAVTTALHQQVAQGQVIARLDDTELLLRLTRTNQELAILRAEIDKEKADIAAQTGRLENKRNLDATIERRRRTTSVASARLAGLATRAEIEEVRIRAQGAAIEADRIASLTEQGLASPSRLVQLRTLKEALQKRLTELEKVHRQQGERTKMFAALLAEFQPQPSAPTTVETSLTPMRLKVQKQATELEQIEHQRQQLLLRAPIPGQVTELAVTEGEWAASGQRIATIVASKPNGIVAYIATPHSAWLAGATQLEVRTPSRAPLGTTIVRSVSPTAVRVPRRLWRDPNAPEWATAIELAPTGRERPGDLVHIVHPGSS